MQKIYMKKNENVAIISNRILVSYLIARNEIVANSSLRKIRIALSLRIIIFTLNLISTRIQCFVGNVHKNSLIISLYSHFPLPRK